MRGNGEMGSAAPFTATEKAVGGGPLFKALFATPVFPRPGNLNPPPGRRANLVQGGGPPQKIWGPGGGLPPLNSPGRYHRGPPPKGGPGGAGQTFFGRISPHPPGGVFLGGRMPAESGAAPFQVTEKGPPREVTSGGRGSFFVPPAGGF